MYTVRVQWRYTSINNNCRYYCFCFFSLVVMFKYNQGRDRFVPDRHRSPYSFYSLHRSAGNHQYECVSNCGEESVSTHICMLAIVVRLYARVFVFDYWHFKADTKTLRQCTYTYYTSITTVLIINDFVTSGDRQSPPRLTLLPRDISPESKMIRWKKNCDTHTPVYG